MYHLYYTMESSAMGCHAALEKIGADFPSLARNAALVEARPAVQRMLEVQGEAA